MADGTTHIPAPFPFCVTAPAPSRASKRQRWARFILVSGTLRTNQAGLFLHPDHLWSRAFGVDDGWYVARWDEIAAIELRRGGRYSFRRARLRVYDGDGAVQFRAEVAHHGALEMLRNTDLVEERRSGMFDHRRFVAAAAVALVP